MSLIEEHSVTKLKISDIQFDPTNPNVMNQQQMSALRKSMQKYGYLTPVVVDQNLKIADGEHRVLIYKELGLTEIPAIIMQLETDADRRQLRQVMNKLRGEHDKPKDADELLVMFENNKLSELAELIAQPKEDLEKLLQRYHPELEIYRQEQEQDIDAELAKPAITKLGDIYQLGRHRLMCGDCTDKRSVGRLLEDKKVDMLLTDPPYGVDYGSKNEYLNTIGKGNRIETPIKNDSIEDYRQFFGSFLRQIPFSEYNTCYIFMSNKELHNLRLAVEDIGIQYGDYLVWIKNNHVLGQGKDYNAKHELVFYGWKHRHKFYGDFSTTVLMYDKPQSSSLHSIMKPITLLTKLIMDGSQQGMTVYDPFIGSGSTLIAAEQTNRICCAMEIDPHYCEVTIKRWENYTGQKALKVTTQSEVKH